MFLGCFIPFGSVECVPFFVTVDCHGAGWLVGVAAVVPRERGGGEMEDGIHPRKKTSRKWQEALCPAVSSPDLGVHHGFLGPRTDVKRLGVMPCPGLGEWGT